MRAYKDPDHRPEEFERLRGYLLLAAAFLAAGVLTLLYGK